MPDLPDDLSALLRSRAGDAPVPPAPPAALLRSVRRRQRARAVAAGVATLAAVVGIGAAVALPRHDAAITPAKPGPTTASPAPDDKYEFCTGTYAPELDVAVATSELKFAYGCYRVRAGAGSVTFTNPQPVPHNLVVAPEGGEPFFKTEVLQPKPGETASIDALLVTGLKAGDYSLTCMVHPSMHAMLVVR